MNLPAPVRTEDSPWRSGIILVQGNVDCQQSWFNLDWVPPVCTAGGSGEEQYILSASDTFLSGANHQAGFSPWHAIGWCNTMTTGKRRQVANSCFACDVAGGQEHHSPAKKPSNLIKYQPGHRQFYCMKVGILR